MLDIVIPVYNEAGNILKTFDEISENIHSALKVFIVYDFEEDTTIPIVKNVVENKKYKFQIKLIKNSIGRGALSAIITGLNVANDEYVLVMMADLSDKLDIVDQMVMKMDEGYDVVCGSRYMKGGSHNGGPLIKNMFSKMAGLSLHALTGIPTHDCSNSFKMYSKRLLNSINFESSGGFEIGLEIVVKAYINGYKITEVPSQWYDREEGKSHFHMWKWMPNYLHWYLLCIKSTLSGKVKRKN